MGKGNNFQTSKMMKQCHLFLRLKSLEVTKFFHCLRIGSGKKVHVIYVPLSHE